MEKQDSFHLHDGFQSTSITGRKLRRESSTSRGSEITVSRQSIGHDWENIHQSASRSATLTTFNEFAPPPATSGTDDARGIASQLQNGLEGVYSRFRSSVGRVTSSRPQSSSDSRPPTRSSTGFRSSDFGNHTRASSLRQFETLEHPSIASDEAPTAISTFKDAVNKDENHLANFDLRGATSAHAPTKPATTQRADEKQWTGLRSTYSDGQPKRHSASISDVPSQSSAAEEWHGGRPDMEQKAQKGRPSDTTDAGVVGEDSDEYFLLQQTSAAQKSQPDALQPPKPEPSPSFRDFRPTPRIAPSRESMLTAAENTSPISKFRREAGKISAASSLLSLHGSQTGGGLLSLPQPQQNRLLNEMRRKVISRDFWMKDENAKVCFNCGDRFSTFRRKHHCRTCGQIYDAKCTILIPGKLFGQEGRIRVCKTCDAMINGDDSSEFSEEDVLHAAPGSRQIRFTEPPYDGKRSLLGLNATTPNPDTIPRPNTRQRPASGHLDSDLLHGRPGSPRSMRSFSSRPRSASHRHRRPGHVTMPSAGNQEFDQAFPYAEHSRRGSDATARFSGFHGDSMIDPDLAPFISEDEGSDEEGHGLETAMNPDGRPLSALRAPSRGRPKSSSKSLLDAVSSKDSDAVSIKSVKVGARRKQLGARTLSTASNVSRPVPTPRVIRSENLFSHYEHTSAFSRIPRSYESDESIRPYEAKKDPTHNTDLHSTELYQASTQYAKKMLSQFFRDDNISDFNTWADVLVPIIQQCASDVDPNISRGDDIDIRHYIKMKQAPGGSPRDTRYVSGVVFTKNLALKGMPRLIKYPRLLIVSFPLEYARHQKHFISLEPVIAQEREYLRKLVNRIIALKAQILLVQANVSGIALEYLHEAGIAVAYNVKESSLRAVARCTQTKIISSVDKLTMNPMHLGHCDIFEVKTFVYAKAKKTHMLFAGCQKDLGCTIILRGASNATLSKLKPIVEFLCYVVYNFKLESALIRDEFMSVPDIVEAENDDGSIMSTEELKKLQNSQHDGESRWQNPAVNPLEDAPSAYGNMVQELRNRLLSISPFVKLAEPYLLRRGLEQENQMRKLWSLVEPTPEELMLDDIAASRRKFELVQPEMVYGAVETSSPQVKEALRAIHRSEYDKALHRYTHLKQRWEAYVAGSDDPFNPLSHQQIVVLFSVVSTKTADSCVGPDLLGLDFYQEQHFEDGVAQDLTLGEYVERISLQVDSPCLGNHCEKRMIDHHRQYVHGDGQVSVYVERQASKLPGMENIILMWSTCRHCDYESQLTPMSASTWKYSFGKYLELSFWSQPMLSRTGTCVHDVHKQHIRHFGFHGVTIRLQYDPINVMEILVPRSTIGWKVDKDLEVKNREYCRIEERLSKFMASVKTRIRSIQLDSIEDDDVEECKEAIGSMIQRAGDEHENLLRKLQDKYLSSKFYEIIPMNRAIRAMQETVSEWDSTFADFEQKFFPSEKDIRRLAAQQLKRMYLSGEDTDEEDEIRRTVHEEADQQSSKEKLAEPPAVRDIMDHLPSSQPEEQQQRDEKAVEHLDLAISQTISQSPGRDVRGTAAGEILSRTGMRGDGNQRMEDIEPGSVSPSQMPTEGGQSIAETLFGLVSQPPHEERTQPKPSSQPTSPKLLRSATSPTVATRKAFADADPNDEHEEPPLQSGRKVDRQPSLIPTPSKLRKGRSNHGLDRLHLERALLPSMAAGKAAVQSLIPRPIRHRESENRVSALAKHFEAMSRQFEKERLKERRQRAERNRISRVYPLATLKPVVEVFRDAHEAVREHDIPSFRQDEIDVDDQPTEDSVAEVPSPSELASVTDDKAKPDSTLAPESIPGLTDNFDAPGELTVDVNGRDVEAEEAVRDAEATLMGDSREDSNELDRLLASDDGLIEAPFDLAKHERNSLLKMLTSFWSERSASGWTALDYPLAASDHIFADSDIIMREDEPSSLIAISLSSRDYLDKVQKSHDRAKAAEEGRLAADSGSQLRVDDELERALLGKTATHMKYQFQAGQARMLCKIFYAESFDAIRRKCGVTERFVESLSRCLKWDSRGGKTKSLFLKTLDERFVIKSLSPVETQAFLKFAPDYFDYMSRCLFHSLPSALAKMLGFYQVVIKNPATGTDMNYFLQVMENVFYEGPSNKMFDLKGSMRNRRVETTGEKNEVLLDENMLDYMSQSPVYIRNHSNSLLSSSISNDTLFCAKQNVMDYSLIVGLYDDRKELMVGIIDYIRTYTWDKKLESWIKDRGKHKATVRSPKEYRTRFRASIPRYFPLAPSAWHGFGTQRTEVPLVTWEMLGVEEEDAAGLETSDSDSDLNEK